MELFITYAQGVSLRVVIWPMEMKDFLDNFVLMAIGAAQSSAPTVGDVPKILKNEAKLVQMSLPNPWDG